MSYFTYQGKNIYFTMKGKGPLLLILPGNTASSAAHENEINYFSDRYCAASIDFLGTGKSDRLAQWTVDWWEADSHQIAALIDHLGYESAVLLGSSGGAITAIATAINYPERAKAVIADSFALHFTEAMYTHNVLEGRTNPTEQQRMFWTAMHGPDWQTVIDNDSKMIKQVVENGGACIKGAPEAIACPVLLTFAEHDSFLPNVKDTAAELEAAIQECEVKIFPNGDHPLMWTNPEGFFGSVESFLHRISQ